MARLVWTEDKLNDYRGNHGSFCFKVNNSDHIFAYDAAMTYKTFKTLTRKFAQSFNSNAVEVIPDNSQFTMLVSARFDYDLDLTYFKFKKEIPVNEGQNRKFEHFTARDIF